jgi:signal transduction histidine kinase
MAAPVFDHEGTIAGTVCATVGTSTILNIVLNVGLGETGECYLVDKEGTFLAHKESRRILEENIAQSGSFKNIFAGETRQKTYLDYRGIEVLGISRKVPGTDWYLVVEQDRNEAFESADLLRWYIGAAMAFSISCAVFLSWAVARHFVHPIGKLSKAANRLAGGEFDEAAVQTNRKDEIGLLYKAFDDMAVQLRQRQLSLEKEVDRKVSELRETDSMLRQSRLAAARSEKFSALGRLGAGVAHEIRTPLTSIKLFLESVECEIEISPEYEEDFRIAMRQIRRIETTINRFLDFTKPRELIFSVVDIGQVVDDVISVVRPMANKQECSLEMNMQKNLKNIKGDRKLLEEAFINLMINSLEAMENGGRMVVAAAMDHREINGENISCVRVDVADTGQGIAEESIANIFDPFFTTKSSGTGLGLSLVHSSVQRHGGAIGVRSPDGGGTVFSIFLPSERNKDFYEDQGKNTDY